MNEEMMRINENKKSSDEIEKIPDTVESLEENPAYRPILDYQNNCKIFESEEKREAEELSKKIKELKDIFDDDLKSESIIAQIYEGIISIYHRLTWIYIKNVSSANTEIGKIKKIIDKYYISKKQNDIEMERAEEIYMNNLQRLNKKIKELQSKTENGEEDKDKKKEENPAKEIMEDFEEDVELKDFGLEEEDVELNEDELKNERRREMFR